ncbi:non-lysosomal glucosylceramidase [Actinocatenispora rupis]|uniref:Beta-Glucocerebrosidase 2 N terminal n=2 Tax=Actinocatenispora rupis TaxID=519421 RepID=A0A8J3J2T7_9ACTN|nr:hypothetical protein Aru02nite_19540 [Actinocatenispora rupis]
MEWPWLREYTGDRLRRISLPLGGIGTGTIGFAGRGHLTDWELLDHPDHGNRPRVSLFALRLADTDGTVLAVRALEGPLDDAEYDGAYGSAAANQGLPRFPAATFRTAYPLGQLDLGDPDLPVAVTVRAWNPFVPSDVPASSLPVAALRYAVTNRGERPLDVSVLGAVTSPLGDGADHTAAVLDGAGLGGVELTARGGAPYAAGSLALGLLDPSDRASRRTRWPELSWGDGLLSFWTDFADDGVLTDPPAGTPIAAVADTRTVAPGATVEFTYLIGWHVPVRRAWRWLPLDWGDDWDMDPDRLLANHYARDRDSAADVLREVAPRLGGLTARTVAFVRAFVEQDVPPELVEAALFTASTLRTQTCFRTDDGHFFGWEGVADRIGSCHGNCTHVWHYEYATAHLFGELSRSMRTLEFAHATDERGLMSFRIGLPLAEKAREWPLAAADGQLGAIVRLWHDWRLSGDDHLLRTLWPAARRALEFCWIPGGWDADRDGVLEGVQHNTYDVEFYGPNPQEATWYLAALDAAARIADHVGDPAFAATCRALRASGQSTVDTELFNGEYYVQRVTPAAEIADGLRHPSMGATDPADPPFQLGDGCLTDQLVGEVAARLVGLGPQLDPAHTDAAARAVLAYNWRDRFDRDLNHMRGFALGDERGLLVASYPHGNRPERPFSYFSEVMTGFEYTAATALVQAGDLAGARRVVAAVRDRYDGARRNPYDEAECGRHYARAMASWGTLLAWQGFTYDAVDGVLTVTPRADRITYAVAAGDAWGTVAVRAGRTTVAVHEGVLALRRLVVTGVGEWDLGGVRRLGAGAELRV